MRKELMKIFCGLWLVFGAWLAGPALAQNQAVTFDAAVDETTVELGSFIRLTLTISGAQDVAPIKLPDIDGFQSRYLGPSTRVSIVNGSYSSSVAFLYALYPQQAGKFTIPALQVTLSAQTYTSRAISVEVVTAGTQTAPTDQQAAAPTSIAQRLYITFEPAKTQVYQGERVPIKIKLFVNGISVRNIAMPEFDHTGFQTDDFDKPRQYTQAVNGINFQVVEFATYVYPTRVGSLTLGPAHMNCEVLARSGSKRSASRLDGFFDDEFFDNFFGNFDVRTLSLESKPTTVAVQPLPETGQPKDFSGGIGAFDFTMTVSPKDVKAGDPVTVRMRLSGEGNMKSVTLPSLENGAGVKDQFKVYDPQISDKEGEKVLEQVIIPKSEKVKSVPALSFSYFDPTSGQYQTITRGPFDLNVAPAEAGTAHVVAPKESAEGVSTSSEQVGQDIVFIKSFPGTWQRGAEGMYPGRVFWVLFFSILIIWISLWSHYRVGHRLKTDERFAQRMLAPRRARQGLAQAERYLSRQETKEFYDAVYKTLQDYFTGKFHLPSGNVTAETIQPLVGTRPSMENVLTKVRNLFSECDAVRYGAITPDQEMMTRSYQDLREVIDQFERL